MKSNTTTQTLPWISKEQIINPIARPSVTQELSENVILTTVDDLYNWSRLSSLYLSELPAALLSLQP